MYFCSLVGCLQEEIESLRGKISEGYVLNLQHSYSYFLSVRLSRPPELSGIGRIKLGPEVYF